MADPDLEKEPKTTLLESKASAAADFPKKKLGTLKVISVLLFNLKPVGNFALLYIFKTSC